MWFEVTVVISCWNMPQAARIGFTFDDRRFYWPHVVTFPPKAKVTELDNTRTVAQRMFDRVSRLSEFNDNDMFEVRLSWTDDVGMVTQIMRAVTSHFPISQPGLLEPLVTHVSRVLDDTAVCFYFFWYVIYERDDVWLPGLLSGCSILDNLPACICYLLRAVAVWKRLIGTLFPTCARTATSYTLFVSYACAVWRILIK